MKTQIRWTPVHTKILLVAAITTDDEGNGIDWAAYYTPVPGWDHGSEVERWRKHGNKMREEVARIYFPDIDVPWRR